MFWEIQPCLRRGVSGNAEGTPEVPVQPLLLVPAGEDTGPAAADPGGGAGQVPPEPLGS